jgi:hypothetical protein
LADTSDLNPLYQARLQKFMQAAQQAGIQSDIISGYRTNAEQAALYDKYQHGGNLAAPPGGSMHNYGFAADLSSKNLPGLDQFAAAHPEYGIYNNPKADAPHFQMFPWGTHAQDAQSQVAGWKGVDPLGTGGTMMASAAPTPGTTLNSVAPNAAAPAVPGAAPAVPGAAPAAANPMAGIAGGVQKLAGALGGGSAPAPTPMQPPNLQVHQPQVDPAMLQAMMLQQKRPYGLSLGGGPFDDTQGQGYA